MALCMGIIMLFGEEEDDVFQQRWMRIEGQTLFIP